MLCFGNEGQPVGTDSCRPFCDLSRSLESLAGITKMPGLSFSFSRKHQEDLFVFKNCLGFVIHADLSPENAPLNFWALQAASTSYFS